MVRGYKVFRPDWKCRDKQYTCPGMFEEEGELSMCGHGMHFCRKLVNCFNFYKFDPKNKVAEVIAHGKVIDCDDKSCTDKLEIVRELTWAEVLEQANIGDNCDGQGNVGNRNRGNYNAGNYNKGGYNTGNGNTGSFNCGDGNYGRNNVGNSNIGGSNCGSYNRGYHNVGWYNTGDNNAGNFNKGQKNSGDYNLCNYSNGCFNTAPETIRMFNKPTTWKFEDWLNSWACNLLYAMPSNYRVVFVEKKDLTEEEIFENLEDVTIMGGIMKEVPLPDNRQKWWNGLSVRDKKTIMSLPNFDSEIFKDATGIDVKEIVEW